MSRADSSSLRKAARLYVLYVGAGIAAIPAGIAYSLLRINGIESLWTVLSLLVVALSMALLAWRYCEKLYRPAPLFQYIESVAQSIAPAFDIRDVLQIGQSSPATVAASQRLPALLVPASRRHYFDAFLLEALQGVRAQTILRAPALEEDASVGAPNEIRQYAPHVVVSTKELSELAAGVDSRRKAASQLSLMAAQFGGT